GVDELRSTAVIEGNPQIQAPIALGLALERRHPCAQLVWCAVAAPEEAGAHALPHEIGQLPLDRLGEDLHQELHLLWWPRPVLGREGVDGQRLDAEIDRSLDGAA